MRFSPEDCGLAGMRWKSTPEGYLACQVKRVDGRWSTVLAQRVVAERMLGRRLTRSECVTWKSNDGDKTDCRRENLEVISRRELQARHQGPGVSGVRSISHNRCYDWWLVTLTTPDGTRVQWGPFDDPEQAERELLDYLSWRSEYPYDPHQDGDAQDVGL